MALRGLKEKYGLSVSRVANIWSRPHEPAERAIADFLNQPIKTLFPDPYPKTRNVYFVDPILQVVNKTSHQNRLNGRQR